MGYGRTDEPERFAAELKRIEDAYGLQPFDCRTWEDLAKWEAYGRDLDQRYPDEWDHEEVMDLQVKHGIRPREQVEGWRKSQQMRDDLGALREDLYYVTEGGRHPDRLYDETPIERNNEGLQKWARRRPRLERELDSLARDAEHWDHELTDEESEMIQALAQLREAEARERDRDRDDDEYGREM